MTGCRSAELVVQDSLHKTSCLSRHQPFRPDDMQHWHVLDGHHTEGWAQTSWMLCMLFP